MEKDRKIWQDGQRYARFAILDCCQGERGSCQTFSQEKVILEVCKGQDWRPAKLEAIPTNYEKYIEVFPKIKTHHPESSKVQLLNTFKQAWLEIVPPFGKLQISVMAVGSSIWLEDSICCFVYAFQVAGLWIYRGWGGFVYKWTAYCFTCFHS